MEIYPDETFMAADHNQANFILTDGDAGTLSHYQYTEPPIKPLAIAGWRRRVL